jgi:signal transduction histidine kinase
VREVYERRISRLPLPDGRFGVVCYFRDISTQVLAREMIDAARATAEDANRSKSEFLAAMSHELRTPLNAIAGHAQLVEMGIHGPVTAAQREALARIRRSEQHLLSLINDVLNFAKLEAGRVQYDIERVTVLEVVADVVSMIEPQVVAKGLVCGVHVAPDTAVRADREKLRQVLLNLLSNAVKFTKPGGRVTVDTPQGDTTPADVILLRVSDTGIGIPRDKQDAIFDPFVQVHRDLTNSNAGTGLGLAISRDLARGMGGELRVRSVEGEGSTFTVTLPRA